MVLIIIIICIKLDGVKSNPIKILAEFIAMSRHSLLHLSLASCIIALSTSPAFAVDSQLSLEQTKKLSIQQALGQKIFFDTNLSNPPGQACASCHDPKTAFSEPDLDLPVSKGAEEGKTGTINTPTAMYTAFIPAFHFEPREGLFVGGQFLDGRENTLEDQAKQPFINPDEMANPDKASVIEKIRQADYADEFKLVYGQDSLDDVEKAYENVADALANFERSPIFNPFTSKYDYYLAGIVELSEQEARGLQLFEAEDKGNCAACHPSTPTNGKPPLFTDFTYDNLGTPANPTILAAKGDDFVDIGLGKTVVDNPNAEAGAEDGKFKVSTLRNISKTAPYMHNGVFADLREVVDFYNTRDVDEKWAKPEVAEGVNTDELGDLKLTDQEVDDIVAFLGTLSDGYQLGAKAEMNDDTITLPYIRVEGRDVTSKIYAVTLDKLDTAEGAAAQYQVTQLTELSLAENHHRTDIPYYSLDTGILEIPTIMTMNTEGVKTANVMQFKQAVTAGDLVFELSYSKAFQ